MYDSCATTTREGGHVLDGGADQSLRGVHEMAHLTEQPPPLPPIVIPVAIRHRPGGDPVDHELARRDPGQRPLPGQHGGRPAPVEAHRQLPPGPAPGLLHRVEFVEGQRERLLAPHVPPGGQRPRREIGVRVMRGGDDDHLDVGVADQRVRARYRFLEVVALRGPPGGQPAGRGDGHEPPEARGAEGGQQRAGGERARSGPSDPG